MRKNITTFFQSRNLAIVLIILIIVFSIIGMHIPQKSQLKNEVYNAWKSKNPGQAEIFEFLGLTNLFSSLIFLSLASLLFINTLFCTKNMFAGSLRKLRNDQQYRKKKYINGLENNSAITTEDNDQIIPGIKSVLRSQGYKVFHKENKIFAEKNKYGVLGIPLFHVCILFIILVVVFGSTGRMEGDMKLIEGQTLSEEHGNYVFINEGPFFSEDHQKFDINLEKFYPDFKDDTGTPRGAAGKLVISENGEKKKTDIVYSNHIMSYGGYTILRNVYGLAPLLILTNPDGTVYSGSYVTASDLDDSDRYVASFEMGDTGLEGGLMVYMTTPLTSDIAESGDTTQTPILFLKMFDDGKEIYDGTLKLNETVKVPGYDKYLGFYDIKYWSNFYVVKDDSIFLIFIGLGSMTLFLSIAFFMVPKRVWVEVIKDENNSSTEIYIGGKADKFRSLYEEEYNCLVNRIKERIANGTN